MKNFGKVQSIDRPQEVEMTSSGVFVASNIEQYSEEIDNETYSGYQYDYVEYTKDEYITILTQQNATAIAELQEELAAAKVLLGVE